MASITICNLEDGLEDGLKSKLRVRAAQKMEQLEPDLGRLMEATPPWIEDPLKR